MRLNFMPHCYTLSGNEKKDSETGLKIKTFFRVFNATFIG